IRGDFQVTNISKSNIVDVFFYDDIDIWYKCKASYVVADADSGKEKKVTQFMLVSAHHVKEAYERIYESLNNMLVSFVVPDIKESPIVEIFAYEKDDEELNPTFQGKAVSINEAEGTVKIGAEETVDEEETL